ncbi:transcriptional regulator [Vibrio sp. SM6]|uniref:Transcriptional regulator n=1 Tax=Vibrio agarilyticus TaxID=2726741 RepID=A0A7X8TMR7_9VIBR|nr:transcriptional regulator [Vibrio agarilyticus]NLS11601.1 transcriptional regulator [Vibrio agarilyticus]
MSNIGTKYSIAQRFVFDPNNNSLLDHANDEELVRLGSNESRILLLLCENPNAILSRQELHEFVWREQGFEVDDSSLTQAISTLRKLLKDSTKTPEFVKTVPKRGYQLICGVERVKPVSPEPSPTKIDAKTDITDSGLSGNENNLAHADFEPMIADGTDTPAIMTHSVSGSMSTQTSSEVAQAPLFSSPLSRRMRWLASLLLLIALPLAAFALSKPNEAEFRQIASHTGVTILVPQHHPDIKAWLPTIKRCVNQYTKNQAKASDLNQVIVTGGQNHLLVINFVHHLDQSSKNSALRLFTDEQVVNEVCQ